MYRTKVTGNSSLPFARSQTSSYLPSICPYLVQFLRYSEIFVENRRFCLPICIWCTRCHLKLTSSWSLTWKTRVLALPWSDNWFMISDRFSCFSAIPARCRQTDRERERQRERRTDRQRRLLIRYNHPLQSDTTLTCDRNEIIAKIGAELTKWLQNFHLFFHLLKCIRADWPLTMQVEQIKSILCRPSTQKKRIKYIHGTL